MTDRTRAPALEPAPFTTNCRACGAPIVRGEAVCMHPRTGGCATCARAEAYRQQDRAEPPATGA
jgi:hypothetical protein